MAVHEYDRLAMDVVAQWPPEDGPVIAAINRLAGRLLVVLAPLCWGALIVLFAYAELRCS
jgi:hypothetical protein